MSNPTRLIEQALDDAQGKNRSTWGRWTKAARSVNPSDDHCSFFKQLNDNNKNNNSLDKNQEANNQPILTR